MGSFPSLRFDLGILGIGLGEGEEHKPRGMYKIRLHSRPSASFRLSHRILHDSEAEKMVTPGVTYLCPTKILLTEVSTLGGTMKSYEL